MKKNDVSKANHLIADHSMSSMKTNTSMYKNLLIMAIVSYVAMYALMYSMIDSLKNLVSNINEIYMTLMMTASMVIIELIVMHKMYTQKTWNIAILVISAIIGLLGFLGVRNQWGVGNMQFMKAMVPHHAAAILMAKEAKLTDPQLLVLRDSIVSSQSQEIEFMKAKIAEYEK